MVIKVGRLTAAVILIAAGSTLLYDSWQSTHYTGVLLQWWPLLLVLLGLEYLYYGMRRQQENVQTKLDIAGVIGAIVLSAVIGAITNWPSLWQFDKWWNDTDIGITASNIGTFFGEAQEWQKVQKETEHVAFNADNEKISFYNSNGDIDIRTGDVNDIQIDMLVSASGADKEEVANIAEKTVLKVTDGRTLAISVDGYRYGKGNRREPRVDLDITIPRKLSVSWEFHGKNGDVSVDGLSGSVKVNTINGDITVLSEGDVKATTTNGDIEATAPGNIEARTTLGNIELGDVQGELRAMSTNGDIEIGAKTVGGDWNVDTTLGDVTIEFPSEGDYTISGSTSMGDVEVQGADESLLSAFTLKERSMTGKVGNGSYKVDVRTQGDFQAVFDH